MAISNASQGLPTNESAEQTHEDAANFIIGIILLVSALIGCSLAVLALGRDFFIGKNPPGVFVGALVWVDFIGVFSTAVLVFRGFVKGAEWMADSPQCSLQVRQLNYELLFPIFYFQFFFSFNDSFLAPCTLEGAVCSQRKLYTAYYLFLYDTDQQQKIYSRSYSEDSLELAVVFEYFIWNVYHIN